MFQADKPLKWVFVAVVTTLLVAALVFGIASLLNTHQGDTPDSLKPRAGYDTNSSASLVDDPIAAIRQVLPEGWTIAKIEQDTWPYYRQEGSGTALTLIESGKAYLKQQYSAMIWIVPPEYVGAVVSGGKEQQEETPALIADCPNGKIYMWGGHALRDAVVQAVLKD